MEYINPEELLHQWLVDQSVTWIKELVSHFSLNKKAAFCSPVWKAMNGLGG